jgi:RimJ/RimL family protein N-acetyltransferase
MQQQPTLQTARLVLRPFELSDAGDVQRLAGERAVADTTLNIPHPYEDGMAVEWISTHRPLFEAGELANFAVVVREGQTLIGAMGLMLSRKFERGELGYWIGRPYWNKGYCTEAGRTILRYAFETLNLNRVHASHLRRNPASGRVLQKLGMIPEGIVREHSKKWDVFEDLVLSGILKTDWEQQAKHRS